MPKTIQIRIPQVTPDTTALNDLIQVLQYLNRVLVEGFTPDNPDSQFPAISLVGISEGSNNLAFRLEDPYASEYSNMIERVRTREFNKLPEIQHEELIKLNKFVIEKGWSVLLPRLTESGEVEISQVYPIPELEARSGIRALAEIFGQCMRVGGKQPTIQLKRTSGKAITAKTNQLIAKEVAHHLYEDVSLVGEAVWEPETFELLSFKVLDLKTYDLPTPTEAFSQLRELVGNVFDAIDVDKFVRELRYDEEEYS